MCVCVCAANALQHLLPWTLGLSYGISVDHVHFVDHILQRVNKNSKVNKITGGKKVFHVFVRYEGNFFYGIPFRAARGKDFFVLFCYCTKSHDRSKSVLLLIISISQTDNHSTKNPFVFNR